MSLFLVGCIQQSTNEDTTSGLLTESEAREIAEESAICTDNGKLTIMSDAGLYDEEDKEWIFGLEGIPSYCFGAECHVNAETGEEDIQWMCGGANPPPTE